MAPTSAITAMTAVRKQVQIVLARGTAAVRQRARDKSGQMMNLLSFSESYQERNNCVIPAAIADPPNLTIDAGIVSDPLNIYRGPAQIRSHTEMLDRGHQRSSR